MHFNEAMMMQETMRDAAVERLSNIISDKRPDGMGKGKNVQPRRPIFRVHISLDEGWFSLFLLATVVYSTIWCVQAADWVDHLSVLTLTTLIGLITGVIAAKQQRLPRLAVHSMVVLLALLLAYWQTADAFYGGNVSALANGMQRWFVTVVAGGVGEDDSIFLFLIIGLRPKPGIAHGVYDDAGRSGDSQRPSANRRYRTRY